MNPLKLTFRFIVAAGFILAFSNSLSAQYGRYHERRYRHYDYDRYYRPGISVNVGIGNYGYRTYPVLPYGYPYYRRPYNYVHFGPSFGVRINVLPFGYSTINIGPNPYYFYQGIYYRPYQYGGYEVIAPPLGATVRSLPGGTKVTVIDGQKYYELGGTFYEEVISTNNELNYRVVGTDGVLNTENNTQAIQPPVQPNIPNVAPVPGSRVDQLPADCRTVVINQQKYYVSPAGIYYQEVIDNNTVRYEVAGNSSR